MKRQQLWPIGVVSAVLAVAGCGGSDSSSANTTAPSTTDAPSTGPDRATIPTSDAPTTTAPTEATVEPTTAPTTETTEAPTPILTTPPSTTAAPATTTTTTTEAPDPDDPLAVDLALARTALITLDDFPADWFETPNEPDEPDDEDDEQFDAIFEECIGEANTFDDDFLDERKVKTGDFGVEGSSVEADHEVILAPTEADAIAALAKIANEAAVPCLALATQTLFDQTLADPNQTDFPPGMTIGEVTVEILDYGYPSDAAVVFFVVIPTALGDTELEVYLENWYMRSGRALSQMTFSGTNELFPQEGIDELTATVFDRIAVIG